MADGYAPQLLETELTLQPESSGTPACVPQMDAVQVASERVPWHVDVSPHVLLAL